MSDRKTATHARKEREKELRHANILKCAETVMLREGFDNLSMVAVAKEAQLAKGTLYLYFKSKEEIIAQLSIKARQLLLEKFRQAVQATENPLDQIRGILWANFDFYSHNKLYNDLLAFYEAKEDLEDLPEMTQSSLEITHCVVSVITLAQETKAVRAAIDPYHFTFNLWGMTIGTLQMMEVKQTMLHDQGIHDLKQFFHNYVELIISGIKV